MKALIFPEWGAQERCPLTIMRSPAWSSASFSFSFVYFCGNLCIRSTSMANFYYKRSNSEEKLMRDMSSSLNNSLNSSRPWKEGTEVQWIEGATEISDCRRSTSVRTLITSAVSNVLYSCIIFRYYFAILCYFMKIFVHIYSIRRYLQCLHERNITFQTPSSKKVKEKGVDRKTGISHQLNFKYGSHLRLLPFKSIHSSLHSH